VSHGPMSQPLYLCRRLIECNQPWLSTSGAHTVFGA
jgi:hypothetical protein